MIRLNGRVAVYGEVWFEEEPSLDAAVDIIQHRFRNAPIANARNTPLLSLATDLSAREEAIAGQLGKDCRYKIRRADSKDGLRMEFITDPQSRLGEFGDFFDAFAKQKAHRPCDRQWLIAACEARQLALSTVSRNGETLVWHAYVLSGNIAGLQYTGSCFRDRDNDYRALIGRANRWLHWNDMLRLKEMGIARYDWGGMFEDESTPECAGINNFKRDFGGKLVRVYDCTVPKSIRGRMYLPLRDAWRHRKSVREIRDAVFQRQPSA